MLLVFILGVLSMKPLLALNFTECEQCILPENFTTRMKRYGGGRGGAKARGVLRDDKGGGAAPAPAGGGNATGGGPLGASGGGNDTGDGPPKGVMDGGMPMLPGMGGNGSMPLLPNGTLPLNNTVQAGYRGEEAETLNPEVIDQRLPHPDTSRTCQFIFKTEKLSFVAIILFKKSGSLLCMGSIVDHNHVLTAKKCVNMAEAKKLLVIVGCSKAYWGRGSQIKKVRKILNHEYQAALLRLKSRIVYTKFVQPARMPSSATKKTKLTYLYDGPYFVIGFPVDKHGIPGEKIPKTLFYDTQSDWYYEVFDCEKIHTKYVLEPTKVFCLSGDVTLCWGAWGSPVVVKSGGTFLQVGVVTDDSCTSVKSGPYVVFRTDAYADWIRGHLKELHSPT